MHKIVPSLWYDTEAKEAVNFYVSLFDDSEITWSTVVEDTPSGDSEQFGFKLAGLDFVAISAGPFFKLNPSISLMVFCDTVEEMDALWERLIDGGFALMELDKYPFSERFGWVQDRFGLTWQLMYDTNASEMRQKIYPALMYINEQYGHAEEAINHYLDVFKHSEMLEIYRNPAGLPTEKEGTVMFSKQLYEDVAFVISENSVAHNFNFNEAFSFIVYCDTQEEIDYYWEKLTAVPESEVCGWLKDKFGVSWQIVPRELDEMMLTKDAEAKKRVVAAFLEMKKLDIAALREAFKG
ncbi:VOC family protein [Jeotgalibaca sp. A122]|uniref:VOC family protein n=1 Tax=Jeotgalibaca sp. A122 TaxID=3457322 RepID=UPI003FD60B25